MDSIFTFFNILNSNIGLITILISLFFFSIILLHNINLGLVLLIFSIPLSPEITGIFGSEIPIRIDDILIMLVLFVWIMKVARGEAHIYRTPFTAPIIVFFGFMVISTIIGYGFKGTITDPKYSTLVLIKNFEYFAIFFIATNNIHTREQVRSSLKLWMVAYFIVIIHGIMEKIIYSPPRLYEYGIYDNQSNHMGGYLMISTTIAIALLFSTRNIKTKLVYFLLIVLSLVPFFYNKSKQSYMSFNLSLFLVFLLLRRRLLYIPILFILILFFVTPIVLPRTREALSIEEIKMELFKTKIDPSSLTTADARRYAIESALKRLPDNPFLGCGTGYRRLAYYDSQVALLISECGIIGILIFLWLLFRILTTGFRIFMTSKSLYFKAISAAFIASFAGIVIQGIPATVWMITLIIEPFWFFAGILIAMDRINKKEMAFA